VTCDRCGRWSTSSAFTTSKLARAYARRNGWTRMPKRNGQDGGDICPRCEKRP
jgi:hypothetical protein